MREIGTRYDLDSSIDGAETAAEAYAECPSGVDVRLWTLRDGVHVPSLTAEFARQSWQWLAAHSRL